MKKRTRVVVGSSVLTVFALNFFAVVAWLSRSPEDPQSYWYWLGTAGIFVLLLAGVCVVVLFVTLVIGWMVRD